MPFYNPSLLLTGIFPETNFPKVIQKVGLLLLITVLQILQLG